MKFYIVGYAIILVTIAAATAAIGQSNSSDPVFTVKTTGKPDALGDYISGEYFGRYHKYFENACGDSYHLVKFQIDTEGKITDLSFDYAPTIFSQFISDVLNQTSGSWKPAKQNGANVVSKTIILPVYFHISRRCKDSAHNKFATYYPAYPATDTAKPKFMCGYAVQSETNKEILLWPVTLQGVMVEDGWPRQRNLETKTEKIKN
jgi:hypothetical protein